MVVWVPCWETCARTHLSARSELNTSEKHRPLHMLSGIYRALFAPGAPVGGDVVTWFGTTWARGSSDPDGGR
jgi:hypothetical protein